MLGIIFARRDDYIPTECDSFNTITFFVQARREKTAKHYRTLRFCALA